MHWMASCNGTDSMTRGTVYLIAGAVALWMFARYRQAVPSAWNEVTTQGNLSPAQQNQQPSIVAGGGCYVLESSGGGVSNIVHVCGGYECWMIR